MAKLTVNEIADTKLIRAVFTNGNWNVIVSDTQNKLYNVKFVGAENDSNDSILEKTHTALLDVNKYVAPVFSPQIERKEIYGQAPKN